MISQGLINHVVFVVDRSGSMAALSEKVVEVFDRQVADLARLSREMDQETRVGVYLFNDEAECVVYDKDVLRLPSLGAHYRAGGNTALLDATDLAIAELRQTATLHGDHAFLLFVLTDGQENHSRRVSASQLTDTLSRLSDRWTVAALVPDRKGEEMARRFGFLAGNILVWETTRAGLTEAAEKMTSATAGYMRARAGGTRGTSGLFQVDARQLDQKTVNRTLRRLDPHDYALYDVRSPHAIAEFVEAEAHRPYALGHSFYQLMKRETVQPGKEVIIVHKRSGVAYHGAEVRALLGLPDYEVKVEPAQHPDYDIFVQSTSVNRKLVPGTRVLVRA